MIRPPLRIRSSIARPLSGQAYTAVPGESGFLPAGLDEAVEAVELALRLERTRIRSYAVSRFGTDRMVDEYEAHYAASLGEQPEFPLERAFAVGR